ncbi:helix-turn-helix transcriptional regulator [Methylobacterium sp. NEAU 140]|uniref:helix-turn-helix domain-containing protein n=1 Tax=Methylobacterium sp. NEAU 140 TaxID=3064945 RepID=UPI002733BDC3|nr:helix-turn-helix transcriptional regulator [Methylobacterium sp. NEAU 140]MDP4025315.1 helix-turn-helix transcriptional regulator [Methylobacterium sp. NEAU 140]
MRRGHLLTTPPYEVETALKRLGADLRTARLRRNITLVEIAERIGASREVIGEAERGKPSTSVAIYAALLWSYGMVERLGGLADPTTDAEGLRLASLRERRHARAPQALDDDF